MATLDVESVDLAALVTAMQSRFSAPFEGAVMGRTNMRDFVSEELECSELEAEQIVDTLVARRFARLERDADGRELWHLSGGG